MLAGLGIVCLGLVLNALAKSFAFVVIGRALQGLGMAMTPIAIATARERFSPRRRAVAVPVVSGAQIAGVGMGYPLAGLAADLGGVRAAHLCGLALVLTSLVVALLVSAAAMSAAALLAVILRTRDRDHPQAAT